MSEVSKVPNTVLLIKDQRACWRCQRCEILYCKIKRLCMSEESKVVFVAFTQHCIQSTVTHVGGVEGCTLYTVPLPGGKAISAFRLGGLAVHHWSV